MKGLPVLSPALHRWVPAAVAKAVTLILCALLPTMAWATSYGERQEVRDFVEQLVSEHQFDQTWLATVLAEAQRQQSILDAIARPAEKTKTWAEYQDIFLTSKRTRKGVEFMRDNREALLRAEQEFGVPPEIVAAIIGVETWYGGYTGGYRVLDALATLAFDYPKRGKFFRKELREFLLLVREQEVDPLTLKGSYAGAMGYGQFMPSSYRAFAVDFDNDGKVDIWNNPVDAIGSVANYFKAHGWQAGQAVTSRARVASDYPRDAVNQSLKPKHKLADLENMGFSPLTNGIPKDMPATAMRLEGKNGAELWLGFQNFYAITRYNHSRLYAMAVYQLSQRLKRQAEL